MLPRTCVVVPTYWTREDSCSRPDDAIYDHPTAISGSSTLPALLESLEKLNTSSFYLLILIAVTGKDVAEGAERAVTEIVANYPALDTLLFGQSHLEWFNSWVAGRDLNTATSFLDLKNYPKIRNLQLAVPLALGTQAIVGVDDDEIVTDPQFLEKSVVPLGQELNGVLVDGLSGHYLQANGSILLQVDPATSHSRNVFDRKASIMNQATENLELKPGNLVETPFCFGGNMEFSRDLAMSVGFDPEITRGEDIDYLINARMEGKHFFLRKDLRIVHCPPKGGSYKDASRTKLEQDIVRFLYEREKVLISQTRDELHTVTADELKPYPGLFLEENIEEDAKEALQEVGYDAAGAKSFLDEVKAAIPDKIERFLQFRVEWPRAMNIIAGDPNLATHLHTNVRSPAQVTA
jgi:hypothetical protein